jgi:hypothetical protein
MVILYAQTASKQTHPDYNIKAIKLLDSILLQKIAPIPTKRAIQKGRSRNQIINHSTAKAVIQ